MAYVTGTANSLSDLLGGIRGACTANGWTLSGNVLHTGNAYISSEILSTTIRWLGGTGIDGSNALTGAAPAVVRIGNFTGAGAITYPVVWEVHINTAPDEVYVVLNYAVDFYQYVAWGLSDVSDLPGTGMWFYGSGFQAGVGAIGNYAAQPVSGGFSDSWRGGLPFYATTSGQNCQTSYIHHGLEGGGWSGLSGGASNFPWSFLALSPLLSALPNTWNDETVLLPFPVFIARTAGNKVSLVGDLKHIRHCRNDYHAPGAIITLGPDQWKIYPWYRKDTVNRNANGGGGWDHSGTLAYAVRYTGP